MNALACIHCGSTNVLVASSFTNPTCQACVDNSLKVYNAFNPVPLLLGNARLYMQTYTGTPYVPELQKTATDQDR